MFNISSSISSIGIFKTSCLIINTSTKSCNIRNFEENKIYIFDISDLYPQIGYIHMVFVPNISFPITVQALWLSLGTNLLHNSKFHIYMAISVLPYDTSLF